MPIEESEAAMIEPDKTNTFHFDWIIPSLPPSRIPKEKEKVVITAKVVTLGYKPKGKAELYFPRTFHTKKRSSLIINVLS